MRMFKGFSTLPLPLDHPVHDMDDWLRIKHWYEFSEERLAGDWETVAREHSGRGPRGHGWTFPAASTSRDSSWARRSCAWPTTTSRRLIHDMLDTIGDTVVQRAGAGDVRRAGGPDLHPRGHGGQVRAAGRSAPGGGVHRALLSPRVGQLRPSVGARLFDQDSDGDMRPVLAAFLDAGVNLMHPMEPAAGMDIVQIRAAVRQAAGLLRRHRQARHPPQQGGDRRRTGVQDPAPGGQRRLRARPWTIASPTARRWRTTASTSRRRGRSLTVARRHCRTKHTPQEITETIEKNPGRTEKRLDSLQDHTTRLSGFLLEVLPFAFSL